MTWLCVRRRLAICTIRSWFSTLALTKRPPSRLVTSWIAGGRPSVWTKKCYSNSNARMRAPTEKPRKRKAKAAAKATEQAPETLAAGADVKLLVRLYFSGHEKLSHQRWLDRIPAEEPFKSASHRTVKQDEPEFAAFEEKFQNLE